MKKIKIYFSDFVQDLFFYASDFNLVKLNDLAESTFSACIILSKDDSSQSLTNKLNMKDVYYKLAQSQKSLNKVRIKKINS